MLPPKMRESDAPRKRGEGFLEGCLDSVSDRRSRSVVHGSVVDSDAGLGVLALDGLLDSAFVVSVGHSVL